MTWEAKTPINPDKIPVCQDGELRGGVCMKGSIHFRKDRKLFYVNWYHNGKSFKIYKYKGEFIYSEKIAQKLLSLMQSDTENGTFRIENYLKDEYSDVVDYLWFWLNQIQHSLKPAGVKDYRNSIKNYLEPFFSERRLFLHEIEYDTIMDLFNYVQREGRGKRNVMYALRAALDFAWRSKRIKSVPPFPKKKMYGIKDKKIEWLPEDRQIRVIEAIPREHQPIFWWLKFHVRRPGEAVALHKVDFDGKIFFIHRTESARIITDSTKTGENDFIPMLDDFKKHLDFELSKQKKMGIISPFMFVNPVGRKKGKPYSVKTLEDIWKKAIDTVGETIGLYEGLKHSSCSQYINEKGLSLSELQAVTGHKRLESLKHYADTEVARRKELMERKIIPIRGSLGEEK